MRLLYFTYKQLLSYSVNRPRIGQNESLGDAVPCLEIYIPRGERSSWRLVPRLFNNGVEVASSATLPVMGTFTSGDVLNLTLRAFNAGGNSDPSDTITGTAP